MGRVNFKNYMKDIVERYNTTYNTREATFKAIKEKEHELYLNSIDITIANDTKNINRKKLEAELSELNHRRFSNERDYHDYMKSKRAEIDNVFRSRASKEDIDHDFMLLLDSGVLTNNELIESASKFNGNTTMRRIIAKHLSDRANASMDKYERARLNANAVSLQQGDNNKALELFDGFYAFAKKAVRSGLTKGTESAMNTALQERIPAYLSASEVINGTIPD